MTFGQALGLVLTHPRFDFLHHRVQLVVRFIVDVLPVTCFGSFGSFGSFARKRDFVTAQVFPVIFDPDGKDSTAERKQHSQAATERDDG